MPKYFFFVDGDDDGNDGLEFHNDAAARQEALETFAAMVKRRFHDARKIYAGDGRGGALRRQFKIFGRPISLLRAQASPGARRSPTTITSEAPSRNGWLAHAAGLMTRIAAC
jgi:hypothetical protein